MNAVIFIAGQYIGIEVFVVLVKFAVFLAFLAMFYSIFGNYLVTRYVLSLYHKKNGEKTLKVRTIFSGKPSYRNLKTAYGQPGQEWYVIPVFMGINGACDIAAGTYRRYQQEHGVTLVGLNDLGEPEADIAKRLKHAMIDRPLSDKDIDAFIFELRAERINRRNWLWRIFN